ncbi:hypothetical protein L208DRAFT_1302482, partial [Tricholoma matsutake]
QYFKQPGECQPHPGNLNLSLAWFQQAHDTAQFKPEISAPLKPGNIKTSTQTWLEDIAESLALMGAFLNVAHPELYAAGRKAFLKLIEKPDMVKDGEEHAVLALLQFWTIPFSGYSLISDGCIPFHRDNNSQGSWFNFLTTIGEYESGSRLILKNLQMELKYNSGTMVALLGKLVRHGTTEFRGNWICIAQYMRDNVLNQFGIQSPQWMTA